MYLSSLLKSGVNILFDMMYHLTIKSSFEKPLFISIKDVQKDYLPMLSLKRIRKLVTFHVHTLRVGNKILVDRDQLEKLLLDEDREILI